MASISIDAVLKQLTKEAMTQFIDKMEEGSSIKQLKTQRTRLINAVTKLSVASAEYNGVQEMLNKKQNLSKVLELQRKEQYQKVTMLEAVKELHAIEQSIVTSIDSSLQTTSFDVALQSDKLGTAQYAYYQFTKKEMDEMLDIDPRTGDLIIQKSTVIEKALELNKRQHTINMDEFEKFVELMVNTMWAQLQDLAQRVMKSHTARDWKRYVELRAIFSLNGDVIDDNSPQAVSEMKMDDPRLMERLGVIYNFYMQGGQLAANVAYSEIGKSSSITGRSTYAAALTGNRGHIFESYIRQLTEGGSYASSLAGSFGSKPWWAGGDVGDIQVKSMFGNVQQVQVASIQSIIKLASQLLELLDKALDTGRRKTALKNAMQKKIDTQQTKSSDYMDRLIERVAKEDLIPLIAKQ